MSFMVRIESFFAGTKAAIVTRIRTCCASEDRYLWTMIVVVRLWTTFSVVD
jgi:hypothetical protein